MVTMNVSWVEERNLDLCQAGKKNRTLSLWTGLDKDNE